MKKLVILYPNFRNVDLHSDVGEFAHLLEKAGEVSSCIWNVSDEANTSEERHGVTVETISKKDGLCGLVKKLFKERKSISLLLLTQISPETLLSAWAYKFLNRKGHIHLKSELNRRIFAELKNPFNKLYIRLLLSKVDVVSFETKEMLSLFESTFPNLRKKFLYLPHGISEKNFSAPEVAKEDVILYVGHLERPDKGADVLLKAFAVLHELPEPWKIEVVGPSAALKIHIDAMFERYQNLKGRITFRGLVTDREELANLYAKSKILLLTSYAEFFPLSVLEGAYYGCVPVSTDVPGAKEIALDGAVGKFAKTGDYPSIARDIVYYIEHPEELSKQSEMIKAFARKNLTIESIVSKFQEKHSALINS